MYAQRARNKLRDIRRSKGLTQAQLAEAAHMPVSTVSRIDASPYALPSLPTAFRLATTLHVGVDELLCD
jgi:transcriptional regulator with XRE-family HTH domain